MNPIAFADLVSSLSFAAAAFLVPRLPRDQFPKECRVLLSVCLWIYALVGLSNVLQAAGITDAADVYEDSAELLFIPFFVYFIYAFGNARQRRSREETERALRQSQSRYRTLVDNIDLGITLIDASHRVVMTNAATGRLLGRDPSEFTGRHCFREFEGREEVCSHCPGLRAMATGAPQSEVVENPRPDGTRVTVRIHAFPVPGPNGAPGGFIEVVEDITAQRRAEEDRRRLEQRVQQAQKLESLGILAGGIAHDFNNLLMAVMGNADLALGKVPAASPAGEYLRKAVASAERAAQLTGQMLAYAGETAIATVPSDVSRLVEDAELLLRSSLPASAALQLRLEPQLPPVDADPARLQQVLRNLVANAAEALADRPGTVTISTGQLFADHGYLAATFPPQDLPEGLYAYLEVSDDGPGMDAETLHRVFDPFYSTKFVGRGLGLPAVLGIVRSHRGAIRVDSDRGRGTTVRVLLPARPRESVGPGGPGPEPSSAPRGERERADPTDP